MNRRGRSKPQFLARLPSANLIQWLENRVGERNTRVNNSGMIPHGTIDMRVRDQPPTVVAAGVDFTESCDRRADRKKRADMPIVRKASKGDASKVRKIAIDPHLRAMAQCELEEDMYALTSKAPRDARLVTWQKFHCWWYGEAVPMLPLTTDKICKVSALFKAGGYKSYKNYISTAKDLHIAEGYAWSDQLWRITQKCAKSVLRGLGGPVRSEQFDLLQVIRYLEHHSGPLARGGPKHPLAMVLCATFFMMRELEVSAIEMEDVTFTETSIAINLPVSKVDWAAKGCRRTWTCVCSKGYPCPVHVLKSHDDAIRASGYVNGPWFPDASGAYCTKEGVVETIRLAVHRSGGVAKDVNGAWLVSGHTFRITGARTLSAWGLDPVTIQLLGRWGSMAVLSYLAESPLIGFADRLKDTSLSSSSSSHSGELVSLAECVTASAIPKPQDNGVCNETIRRELNKLARDLENVRDDVEGISHHLEDRPALEVWTVVNDFSNVAHRATVDLSTSPSEWKTGCGWHFAGKRHAVTHRQPITNSSFRPCPKCHHLKREDSSDSDSSSSSSEL